MSFSQYIREIGKGPHSARDLTREEARFVYGAILDGGVPDFEMGAIITALRLKGESLEEMLGFHDAALTRTHLIKNPSSRYRPVVLPSYNGARKNANLTALLALLLQRHGVPVMVHGLIEGFGRVTTAQIFRELGVMPTAHHSQVEATLEAQGLVFVPLPVLSQGLANQLALRARTGLRNAAHSLVKMLDPFRDHGLLVMAATHPPYLEMMSQIAVFSEQPSLLLRATEGEPFANPKRRPNMNLILGGVTEHLFEAEHDSIKAFPGLPEEPDAKTTAKWIRQVLKGDVPVPHPIAHQLAACLYGCGYAETLSEAKAIVAVEAVGLVGACA
jgi:anthranilate phosphoribosyltransferase